MEYSIEIKNLQKSFGDVHAVNDLSFRVKKGELFAFLGVNGAGKSTLCAFLKAPGPTKSGAASSYSGATAASASLRQASVSFPVRKPLSPLRRRPASSPAYSMPAG